MGPGMQIILCLFLNKLCLDILIESINQDSRSMFLMVFFTLGKVRCHVPGQRWAYRPKRGRPEADVGRGRRHH
jgi:hypothetical protein